MRCPSHCHGLLRVGSVDGIEKSGRTPVEGDQVIQKILPNLCSTLKYKVGLFFAIPNDEISNSVDTNPFS